MSFGNSSRLPFLRQGRHVRQPGLPGCSRRPRGMQRMTSSDKMPACIVLLLLDHVHNVIEGVVGDAVLDVVADEFSARQSLLLILRTGYTPSVQGLRHCLRQSLQHCGGASFTCPGVTFEAFLPVPASGVGHGDLLLGDEVVAVLAEITFGPEGCAELLLQKVHGAVGEMFQPTAGSCCMSSLRNRQRALQKIMYSRFATLLMTSLEKACAMARINKGCRGWP